MKTKTPPVMGASNYKQRRGVMLAKVWSSLVHVRLKEFRLREITGLKLASIQSDSRPRTVFNSMISRLDFPESQLAFTVEH